ncbi:unnamed protein product [Aureobasidium pullulans]|nr:unnamed protein product [Aureobasidium pullulans]
MSTSTNRPLAVPKSRVAAPKPTTSKHPSRVSISDQGAEEQDLPYEEREMRNQAARVLANDEMLLWLSRQRNEVCVLPHYTHTTHHTYTPAKFPDEMI